MRIDVLTLFPEQFRGFAETSIVRIAREKRLLDLRFHDLRDYTTDRHRTVDDRPFGGGPGMVLKVEPYVLAVEDIVAAGTYERAASSPPVPHDATAPASDAERLTEAPPTLILLTPQGRKLDQPLLEKLASEPWLVVLCGHYEGFDERIPEILEPLEVSIGDYVLSGGEVAAPVLIDGVTRLIPGVLGHPKSAEEDSFSGGEEGLLDYPQYTRPREFRGRRVPDELLTGDHVRVAAWRAEQARERTRQRRSGSEENSGS